MKTLLPAGALAAALLCGAAHAQAPRFLPDGHFLTPTAAPGANFQALDPRLPAHPAYRAGQALNTCLSPDGKTLAVLTSGFNILAVSNPASARFGNIDRADSSEYLFLYDVSGANRAAPAPRQVLKIPNSFAGLVFSPNGNRLYVSGGRDDAVRVYARDKSGYALAAIFPLGHHHPANPRSRAMLQGGLGFRQVPMVANLALTPDGKTLLAVNSFNASVTLLDAATGKILSEYDLRPFHTNPATGQGRAGGEIPFAAAIAGTRAYVGSLRDRDITVLNIANPAAPVFIARLQLPGTPLAILPDSATSSRRIFVAEGNAGRVAVIDSATDDIVEEIDARAPPGLLHTAQRVTGVAPNHLALSPNHATLYVTNGGQNAVAVIPIAGPAPHHVTGLIPTGWYPHALTLSADGRTLYIVNGKSDPGPNPLHLSGSTAFARGLGGQNPKALAAAARAANQYILQREHAGLLALPVPDASTLSRLTATVARNDRYTTSLPAEARRIMAFLHARIRHVIYIVKENRTFDQILGDVGNGADADPALAMFGARVTPNLHATARNFVIFDNFYDASEVSGDGWQWTTAARETDVNTKFIPLDYAHRGAPYDAEGQNSGVDVGIASLRAREAAHPGYAAEAATMPGGAANLLPGTNSDTAPDGPDGARQQGYLWNAAARAGLSIRNYGFYIDLDAKYPNVRNPYAENAIEAYPTDPTLAPVTDPYFRSFDNTYPDYWRYLEWHREFKQFVANGKLPQLTFLRYMHDHMGDFATAVAGVNFPEAQQADDDYAVGLTLQAIANSPYAKNTLVFIVEDDAQDGPDHVSAHRSTAYIVGPYVRHNAVDHARYTQVSMLRTIEDVLGLEPMNLNDAFATPMWTAFDPAQKTWSFTATPSAWLKATALLPPHTRYADQGPVHPVHAAAWWARATRGYDWSHEDRIPAAQFNHTLWAAFRPGRPYPMSRQ